MRVLIALTYYRPHYSGLTIYAERLARALVQRGHQVTVLTSRYTPDLPPHEVTDGVEIIRLNVGMHISKGVLMPAMLTKAWQLVRRSDVVHLHVPQLDAAYLALVARLLRKPVVLTYHCDLRLPAGLIHYLANQVSHLANHIAARAANLIVTNTGEYAEQSDFLKRYLWKIRIIPPPVELPPASRADLAEFMRKYALQPGERIIGMAARLATEKGVETLVQALPRLLEKYPTARVLFVGQYRDVFGERAYAQMLAPLIERLDAHWQFLGVIPPHEFTAFMHFAEVTVLPSLNSTESFGMVQIEAMVCGTPVVASDLPGVRQPVQMTGMGLVFPPGDAQALAEAIIAILDRPQDYRGDPSAIARRFSPDTIAEAYEGLFRALLEPVPEKGAEEERSSTTDLIHW
ncbi:MAG TPA: glycosyltransferase family 4 protein [Anaerolineales bacterium]|nr:glycosyltransferase family 4 protein [Anaerolineales bacterium]